MASLLSNRRLEKTWLFPLGFFGVPAPPPATSGVLASDTGLLRQRTLAAVPSRQ